MSRYGWSSSREAVSPYGQDGSPHVTEEDYSYITSKDILEHEDALQSPARTYDPRSRQPPTSALIEDDVLLIKNKGITYPLHFPAYSIGDGKLQVRDVRDRVGVAMEVNDRRSRRIRLLYKGRQLKEPAAPVRDYGVKNNSEILIMLPEADDEDSSNSSEEVVVTDPAEQEAKRNKRRAKNKKRRDREREKKNTSPRDSTSNLEVPSGSYEAERRSSSRPPSRVPSPAVPNGPIGKLDAIKDHFNTTLMPLCREFRANPPSDPKKREDEHRKLSETILAQVLLKLDEVDTGGDPDIRARRKALVDEMHVVLKGLDSTLGK